jgi:hypothetical protein
VTFVTVETPWLLPMGYVLIPTALVEEIMVASET